MNARLLLRTCALFLMGALLMGLLLFLPAGTFQYWNAWLLIIVLFIPMFIVGMVLLLKKPELLEKRLKAKEKEAEQKSVVALSAVMFIVGFVVAALDFRFGWLPIPFWLVTAATIVFLTAYGLYAEVIRENAYLSRTVEVQENQKVVDTGLYGIIRHPMYSATLLLFLAMPLILGSVFSLMVFMLYPVLIIKRIRNEEQVLEANLAGYAAYTQRVRYRLIPFIW